MSVKQFGTCRIPEYFARVVVYPRFNDLYSLVAYGG